MKNLGQILKKIREAKGLSLYNIANDEISTSQLSRFENGYTDITLSKLLSVLKTLDVSLEEFMYLGRGFHKMSNFEVIDKINNYFYKNNSPALRRLLINCIEKEEEKLSKKLTIILIKLKLQEIEKDNIVTSEEIDFISDYLFSIDIWGEYELELFSSTMEIFCQSSIMILTKEMVRRTDFYKHLPTHRRLITSMLFNAFSLSVERNNIVDASYYREQLVQLFFDETELYERLVFHLIDSCYNFKMTNELSNILEMRKCIGFLKTLDSMSLVDRWEKYIERVLNSN
ncbi:helix-turn-helix domain-containing protein [Streptococcus mitis]|uniref:helix-turn-helix domain-containing protein n=1 Tax=Streptococcus mitis TaxID=28037 RepID=UPI0021B70006|nr:Rgg/GadR/MutR family transcriptional regulator [Streptococcus mitis]